MKRAIVVPAPLPVAARDELKSWLAISSDSEDAFLDSLLRAGFETCEAFTGTMALVQTCEEFVTPTNRWQALSAAPVQSIDMLTAQPEEGASFAINVEDYEVDIDSDAIGRLRWLRPREAVRPKVSYTVGMASDWDGVPDGLRQGIVRLAAHYYRERDGRETTPPASVAALWRPWRRLRLT